MARDLKNIRFTRVALVDKGANFHKQTKDGAHILLWKRQNEEKIMPLTLPEWVKKMFGVLAETDETLKAAGIEELSKAFPGAPTPGAPPAAPVPGAPPAPADPLATLKAIYASIGTLISSMAPPAAGVAPHPAAVAMKSIHADLAKALGETIVDANKETQVDAQVIKTEIEKATIDLAKKNEDLEKRLQASEEANTATANILKAERNQRLDAEMVSVLKSFKATSLNLDMSKEDNDVKKFRKMQEADPDGFARVIEVMKATDASIATGALFSKQIGSGRGGAAGSAEAQLTAKAEELRKSDNTLTAAAAFEKASLDNPSLVVAYRKEQQ